MKENAQQLIYKLIDPLVRVLIKYKISPNFITTIGLFINAAATAIFIVGAETAERSDLSYVGWAGATILFGGLFDMIDGRLARLGEMTSTFGALYDSVLDRYSELIMFFGICYFLVSHDYFFSSIFAFFALIGSIMVSYTRARAEGLGIDCSVGLMQRPERVVIIGVAAVSCGITSYFIGGDFRVYSDLLNFPYFETISVFTFPITIVAVLANWTGIKRLIHCRAELLKRKIVSKEKGSKPVYSKKVLMNQ